MSVCLHLLSQEQVHHCRKSVCKRRKRESLLLFARSFYPYTQAGGNVVRLVGLYHANRGAHTYFLRAKEVQRPGDYLVNLLHYEDAARLSTSVSGCDVV